MIRFPSIPLPRPRCRRPRLFAAALLCLAVLASGAQAGLSAPRVLYTDPDTRPAGPAPLQGLAALDCTGAEVIALAAEADSLTRNGDTTTGAWLATAYDCRLWSEWGPEIIYQLDVTADLQLWAGLSGLGDVDLDLFLLSACDATTCIVGANTEMFVELPAGTYWLVVDGYGTTNPAAGPYTLTLQTRPLGVPQQVCDAGGATAVECAGAAFSRDGDLFNAPDLMRSYDCSPSMVTGGEAWYAITLPGLHEVTLKATPDAGSSLLDLALWLFDGCGTTAACLDYADLKAGGQPETLAIANTSAEPLTVYLAVDCRRAPAVVDGGAFAVEFLCHSTVATEQLPLGSVRALYR
jgi:hypothetical protein